MKVHGSMKRRGLVRGALVTTAVVALGMTYAGAAGAQPRSDRDSGHGTQAAQASLLAALQRDLHLTAAGARQLLTEQAQVMGLDKTMSAKLGADYGGSWFDRQTGKLIVTATKPDRASLARSAKTDTRVVKYSERALDSIKKDLDALSRQDRKKLSAATTWSVDVQRNQVVVTVRKGQSKAIAPLVARYGDAVRVVESQIQPTLASDFLDGGDPFDNTTRGLGCSVGFNVAKDGVGYFLTAGHCGQAGDATQQSGVGIGPFVQSFFPNFDDALIRNDNPGFWAQGPWVFAYNGDPNAVYNLSGFLDSPVGTAVCKSGRTTGLTCGSITAKNQTVNYVDPQGNPIGSVSGLTQHSACVEHGDSGGSNFSFNSSGNFAEGMTSGAALVNNQDCLEKHGQQNVSFYFPVAASIAFYGVTLMTL